MDLLENIATICCCVAIIILTVFLALAFIYLIIGFIVEVFIKKNEEVENNDSR